MQLYRVILPVNDIERAIKFYAYLLDMPGESVSPSRYYFKCGGVVLVCYDPKVAGDEFEARPNMGHLYFAVPDLEAVYRRAEVGGCHYLDPQIHRQPWGERMFYVVDPFDNPLCFVDETTIFTGYMKEE